MTAPQKSNGKVKKKLRTPDYASSRLRQPTEFNTELIDLSRLHDHPKNYRTHPPDELDQIIESIREHGIYRAVVVAVDDTILAGHGVVQAARKMGLKVIPVRRLNLKPEDPRALKILIGDNELGHLAEIDDRLLSEILKDVKDNAPEGLNGTGFDDMMLASLVFVSRPKTEIQDLDVAAHWVGMPEYDEGLRSILKVVVQFKNLKDRTAFFKKLNLPEKKTGVHATSMWWPPRGPEDPSSLRWREEPKNGHKKKEPAK